MNPIRVLIVDDERRSQRLLQTSLGGEGYATVEARTAEAGLHAARTRKADLVLLDLDLPDASGFDVIRNLREVWGGRPILVVSARDTEDDKVKALDLGADDDITKPFRTGELIARIRVALRREACGGGSRRRSVLKVGALRLDLERHQTFVGRREVHLTPQEFNLLAYLMKHAGKVVTHPQLLREVWGAEHAEQRTYLRVYIAQLRRKLEVDPSRPRHLLTEPGIGYRLKDDAR